MIEPIYNFVFLVFFDLESTGLDTEYDEIIQIGAVSESGSSFSVFILPQVVHDVLCNEKLQ